MARSKRTRGARPIVSVGAADFLEATGAALAAREAAATTQPTKGDPMQTITITVPKELIDKVRAAKKASDDEFARQGCWTVGDYFDGADTTRGRWAVAAEGLAKAVLLKAETA